MFGKKKTKSRFSGPVRGGETIFGHFIPKGDPERSHKISYWTGYEIGLLEKRKRTRKKTKPKSKKYYTLIIGGKRHRGKI